MDEMIRKDCAAAVSEAVVKNANVNITLEDWPCAVAVLGICATVAFLAWLDSSNQIEKVQRAPVKVVKASA